MHRLSPPGDLGGMTLAPGVYEWGRGVLIPADLTLSGSATDRRIVPVAQGLTVHGDVQVVLAGGARAENVCWQVAGLVGLGTTSYTAGVILSQTAIPLRTGASTDGRLLARTAVSLDSAWWSRRSSTRRHARRLRGRQARHRREAARAAVRTHDPGGR